MNFLRYIVYCFVICLCCVFTETVAAQELLACDDAVIEAEFSCEEVTVTSTKDLSNVVIEFCDGSEDYKYDGLSGYVGTFGKELSKVIKGVWVKSGCNDSGDGPGYGVYIPNPDGCECKKDCLGVPGGDAVVDECGVCNGPGKTGCDNECGSTKREDACGVCDGDNSTCQGCDMVPWSGKVFDECGVCDGDGSSCADCAGVPNGDAELDVCGVCEGDGTSCEIDICYLEWDFSQRIPTEDPSIITIKDFEKPNYLSTGIVGPIEDCDKVNVCYKYETIEIAKLVLPIYGANGPITEGDCSFEGLEPSACAEANGFLGQTNVATVVNKIGIPLGVRVEYTDLFGVVKGSVSATLAPNTKRDFIVNELNLEPDTYGTVCVHTDAKINGAWYGGVTAYKPDENEGEDFDFALYYPFVNARVNTQYAPLNNFRLGATVVANWIRITDAKRDGIALNGLLEFFDATGVKVDEQVVAIPDAGRFDYAGHTGLGGPDSVDGVGFAKFTPANQTTKFYFTVSRYFYDCPGAPRGAADCNNFLSAFVLPDRSPINGTTFGTVTTKDSTMSVVELNNTSLNDASVTLKVYDTLGVLKGTENLYVPKLGTTHYIINGLLVDEVGHGELDTNGASVSVSTYVYDLNAYGLVRGFGTPFTDTPGAAQLSEFNSFLSQRNVYELHNVTNSPVDVSVDAYDYNGVLLSNFTATIPARASLRSELVVPQDTYGTLVIQGDGIIFRNFVTKGTEYILPFFGK